MIIMSKLVPKETWKTVSGSVAYGSRVSGFNASWVALWVNQLLCVSFSFFVRLKNTIVACVDKLVQARLLE